ncbi:RNA polymerase-binding protein RbpA, partial [Streptomyces tirandamycinicus]|uniref:RNA polymerase-binding protein RbpA n=1 Tax=Streptomyces tirandamycinicus TaxID=2174846 RepID=UPI003F4DEC21
MSERALRGTRLVVTSYETDRGIDLAPRQAVEYACQNGHRFEMPFSVEAEIPPEWECKACGAQALLVDGDGPEEKKGKPARTHWDMLMERRTREELEEVLAERLAVLRSGAMNIAVHPRDKTAAGSGTLDSTKSASSTSSNARRHGDAAARS